MSQRVRLQLRTLAVALGVCLAAFLASCATKIYTDKTLPQSLEFRYEPSTPLGASSHFPVSLAVAVENGAPEPNAAKPNSLRSVSAGLGFTCAPYDSVIGDRIVEEITSRGLVQKVSTWYRRIEADYYARVVVRAEQATCLGDLSKGSPVWLVNYQNMALQKDTRETAPLRLSASLDVTLYTKSNLPIARKQFSPTAIHPDALCGDYIWLANLLRLDAREREFTKREKLLKRIREADGDTVIQRARSCFADSYDLMVKDTMIEVADFVLSQITSTEQSQSVSTSDADLEEGKIEIVIASVPAGADVYLDELFVGQTPLRKTVSRSKAHSLQLSKDGFQPVVKLIDPSSLSEADIHLMYRLEPVQDSGMQ